MSSALPALLCAPPRCGNQSLGIKISSLKYPNTFLNIPHPHPIPRLPSLYPMHRSILPPHPHPRFTNSQFYAAIPFPPIPLIHRPARFPYLLRYRTPSSDTVPQMQSLIFRDRLRDSESWPLLYCRSRESESLPPLPSPHLPRYRIPSSATVSESPNLTLTPPVVSTRVRIWGACVATYTANPTGSGPEVNL